MSLINDQQKKNASVKTPVVKPVRSSVLPQVEAAPLPDFVEQQPAIPEAQGEAGLIVPESQASVEEEQPASLEALSPDFMPIAPVETNTQPLKSVLPTPAIWKDVTEDFGKGAQLKPEIVNSTLPSFSVQVPDNSGSLNSAYQSYGNAASQFNNKAKEEYAAAQKAQALAQQRSALPNTPDATKKWSSAPLGFLGDVFFGSEQARKQSEAGVPDASTGSFGRAGAGVGGALNYTLGVIPSLFVGAAGEVTKATANGLQKLGVDKATAEGFARNGFLQFLPDYIGQSKYTSGINGNTSGLYIGALKPSNILDFDFDSANKKNLLLDAIAGDPLTDVNDSSRATKYGRAYTRKQREEGSSATSDPVGLALQIGTYIFNPGEIPGDKLISAGVSKLWNVGKKTVGRGTSEAVEEVGKIINAPALPSSAMRREAALAKEAQAARTAKAGQQLTQPQQQPFSKNPGFDLGALTEEQSRRLNTGTPRLSGTPPISRPLLPGTEEKPLDVGQAFLERVDENSRLQRPTDESTYGFNEDLSEFEPYVEFTAASNKPFAAQPQKVPRAYLGEGEVTTSPLPPTFTPSEVPTYDFNEDLSTFLPYNTPAKLALDIGIGNPSLRLETTGALALRPLEQVKEALTQANPKLLEDFTGITWEDFKTHLSKKTPDIGQFSSIGEDLTKFQAPVKQVTMGRIRERYYSQWKTEDLVAGRVNLFDKPEEKAKYLLGDAVQITKVGESNVIVKADETLLPTHKAAIEQADAILEQAGLKTDVPVDVAIDLTDNGAEWVNSKELLVLGKGDTESLKFNYLHEYAHKLDYLIKSKGEEGHKIYEAFVNDPIVKAYYPTTYASKRRFRPNEQWAEAFATYLAKKEELSAANPEYVKVIEGTIDQVKRLLNSPTQELEAVVKKLTESHINKFEKGLLQVSTHHEMLVHKSGVPDTDALQKHLSSIYANNADDLKATLRRFAPPELSEESLNTVAEAIIKRSLTGLNTDAAKSELAILKAGFKDTDAFAKAMGSEFYRQHSDYIAEGYRKALQGEFQPKGKAPTEDDLFTAAEELAQHKLAIDKNLRQLDSLFDETVDFGRKVVDSVPFDYINPTTALKTVEEGGILKLYPGSFFDQSEEGLKLKNAWLSGDYAFLVNELKRTGEDFNSMLDLVVERSNEFIDSANEVNTKVNPISKKALTYVTEPLYHGTALDSWQPPPNLYVNGSRGELGHGTYFTTNKEAAIDYAKARVGENVSAKTMEFDVNPTVAEAQADFINTLDARAPLDRKFLKQAFADLPAEVANKFFAAYNRKKRPLSYVQTRELLENSLVKAKVEPTEELLQQIDADISKNLRGLGFDSVADKESGFVLSLDNARVGVVSLENVQTPNVIEATTARFNVDAAAAKAFPNLLTSDANLRDSTYKVLEQVREATDQKLASVQDEIIKRGLPEQEAILPKLPDTDPRPSNFTEALDTELLDEGICSL